MTLPALRRALLERAAYAPAWAERPLVWLSRCLPRDPREAFVAGAVSAWRRSGAAGDVTRVREAAGRVFDIREGV